MEKRWNILKEILSTEQAYNTFLSVVIDVYLATIKQRDIVSADDIELIFSNITSIKSANDEILQRLKERIEIIQLASSPLIVISDIFIDLGPFLKIYSIFVNNYYNKAIKTIKSLTTGSKKFKAYLQKGKLQEAKLIMKDVVSYVNQSTEPTRKKEPLQVLTVIQQMLGPRASNLIQPHRRLIKSGELDRLVINSEGVPKRRTLGIHLFNDIIIYAVNTKFWRQLSLSEVWIKPRSIEEFDQAFEVYSQNLCCIFLTDVNTVNWPILIQDTINLYLDNDNEAKEDIKEQEDLTFEEKQFFFESLSLLNGVSGSDAVSGTKEAMTPIESGIVKDRKKKLEHLLLERRGEHQDNDTTALSDINQSPSMTSAIILMRNNIKKEGYLTKIGEVVKNWKRRWFIMENGYLFYLKHKNSSRQLGVIPLIGSTLDSVSFESMTFSVVTKYRTFMLLGDTPEETKSWVAIIESFYEQRSAKTVQYAHQLTNQAIEMLNGAKSVEACGWRSASPPPSSPDISSSGDSMKWGRYRRGTNVRSLKIIGVKTDELDMDDDFDDDDHLDDDLSSNKKENKFNQLNNNGQSTTTTTNKTSTTTTTAPTAASGVDKKPHLKFPKKKVEEPVVPGSQLGLFGKGKRSKQISKPKAFNVPKMAPTFNEDDFFFDFDDQTTDTFVAPTLFKDQQQQKPIQQHPPTQPKAPIPPPPTSFVGPPTQVHFDHRSVQSINLEKLKRKSFGEFSLMQKEVELIFTTLTKKK
eukprot:gene17203-20502_t